MILDSDILSYQNIYNVLNKDNLIKEIEKEINKTLEDNKHLEKQKKISFFVPFTLLFIYYGIPILLKLCGNSSDTINKVINSKFASISILNLLRIITGIPLLITATNVDLESLLDYKTTKKELNANRVKLEFLKKELLSLKENDLKNDNPLIKYFYSMVSLYERLGYDEKKLYKYYLNEKLNTIFEGNSLELATKYFEEKGPVLNKKYKITKKE